MILYGLVEKKMGVLKKYLLTCQGGLHRNSFNFFQRFSGRRGEESSVRPKRGALKLF